MEIIPEFRRQRQEECCDLKDNLSYMGRCCGEREKHRPTPTEREGDKEAGREGGREAGRETERAERDGWGEDSSLTLSVTPHTLESSSLCALEGVPLPAILSKLTLTFPAGGHNRGFGF